MNFLPVAASVLVSERCNLNCSYCFEKLKSGKKMSKDVAKRTVDYLFENFKINRENGLSPSGVQIAYFGGEPFTNYEVMKYMIEYSKSLSEKEDIPVSATIITNGTILNEDMVGFLSTVRDHIYIQISVDGKKHQHDSKRVYHSGKGSYDDIEKNIPLFKEIFGGESYYNRYRENLHLHGSLTKPTVKNLYETYKFFLSEWGVKKLWYMPIHTEDWDQGDVIEYKNQLQLISNHILEEFKRTGDYSTITDYAPLNKCLNLNGDDIYSKPCGAGDTYCCVNATGDIFACHQFYFIGLDENNVDQHIIGNIYDGLDDQRRKIYLDYSYYNMTCGKTKCQLASTCYRCIADNYHMTGSILNIVVSHRCAMSREENIIINNLKKSVEALESK